MTTVVAEPVPEVISPAPAGLQYYIGCELIQAWPCDKDGQAGYAIRYASGYQSWAPQAVFEAAFLALPPVVSDDAVVPVPQASRIPEDMACAFVRLTEVTTAGKTTVMRAVLSNGFEIVTTSACVDPAQYDAEYGADACRRQLVQEVQYLLGFLLQTAREGFRAVPQPADPRRVRIQTQLDRALAQPSPSGV